MSSWLSWVGGKRDNKSNARDAIIGLREQLHLITKKEEYLQTKVDDELRKAREQVTTNKRGACGALTAAAQAALRQKKMYETELDRLAGSRMTLETQVNAIENANLNIETMRAMQRGSAALKQIHASMDIDKVDNTMDSIREQMSLSNEISEAISNPVGVGTELDEDELRAELQELEQDELHSRLVGADAAPAHRIASPAPLPSSTAAVPSRPVETDEEAELRALQAELAM